jgi:hypothetical protein
MQSAPTTISQSLQAAPSMSLRQHVNGGDEPDSE